jgi:uncharacterized protein (TIGR01777 family)
MLLKTVMILFISSRVSGFTAKRATTTTRLAATSFFEDLQKNLFGTTSAAQKNSKFYTIGITGAGGLVGTALQDELVKRSTAANNSGVNGKPVRVVRLLRADTAEPNQLNDWPSTMSLKWNPNGATPEQVIDPSALSEMDAIVHLAGENVATGLGPLGFLGLSPWSKEKKAEILNSRVGPTSALARAIAAKSTPTTFLTASGIGAYGGNFIGNTLAAVDESMDISSTDGFMADVSRQWEAASKPAENGKNRIVNMRFGVVLSKNGGALGRLYPIFFLGGGGRVGSGDQYLSFISARDIARAILHTLETPSLKGPVNFSAPSPCTNAEFTHALGQAISRPTLLPFPEFAVKLLFGEMGEEMLLGGVRALPTKLLQSGFEFLHPTIDEAVQSAVNESI